MPLLIAVLVVAALITAISLMSSLTLSRTVDHIDARATRAECSRHQQALAEERFRDDLIRLLKATDRRGRLEAIGRLAAEPNETDEVARLC